MMLQKHQVEVSQSLCHSGQMNAIKNNGVNKTFVYHKLRINHATQQMHFRLCALFIPKYSTVPAAAAKTITNFMHKHISRLFIILFHWISIYKWVKMYTQNYTESINTLQFSLCIDWPHLADSLTLSFNSKLQYQFAIRMW